MPAKRSPLNASGANDSPQLSATSFNPPHRSTPILSPSIDIASDSPRLARALSTLNIDDDEILASGGNGETQDGGDSPSNTSANPLMIRDRHDADGADDRPDDDETSSASLPNSELERDSIRARETLLMHGGTVLQTVVTERCTQVEVDSDELAPWALEQIARVHGSSTAQMLTAHCDHIARGGSKVNAQGEKRGERDAGGSRRVVVASAGRGNSLREKLKRFAFPSPTVSEPPRSRFARASISRSPSLSPRNGHLSIAREEHGDSSCFSLIRAVLWVVVGVVAVAYLQWSMSSFGDNDETALSVMNTTDAHHPDRGSGPDTMTAATQTDLVDEDRCESRTSHWIPASFCRGRPDLCADYVVSRSSPHHTPLDEHLLPNLHQFAGIPPAHETLDVPLPQASYSGVHERCVHVRLYPKSPSRLETCL